MDIFNTAVLNRVIDNLDQPASFLLDVGFREEQTETSEDIHFDVESDKPRITPFVSPLMQGKVLDLREVAAIASRHGRTISQVVLRWNIQKGVVTIPKSVRRERIEENAQIFDFELTEEDMQQIDALDRNERIGPDPDNVNF